MKRQYKQSSFMYVVLSSMLFALTLFASTFASAPSAHAQTVDDSQPNGLFLPLIRSDGTSQQAAPSDISADVSHNMEQSEPDDNRPVLGPPPLSNPSQITPAIKDRDWYFENWNLTQQDWEEWAKELIEGDAPVPSLQGPEVQAAAVAPPKLNLALGQTTMQSSIGFEQNTEWPSHRQRWSHLHRGRPLVCNPSHGYG